MYVNKFFVWHKKFGPAQNILGPVKGQGINAIKILDWLKKFWRASVFIRQVDEFFKPIQREEVKGTMSSFIFIRLPA